MASTITTVLETSKESASNPTRNSFIPVHATIDDLLRSYVAEPVNTPLVGYPVHGVSDFEEYTARDLDRFADAAVARYMNAGIEPAVSNCLSIFHARVGV